MSDEKPPAPCPVCDRGPADDAGADWRDVTCAGCGRYRLAVERERQAERVEAVKALARRERRRRKA